MLTRGHYSKKQKLALCNLAINALNIVLQHWTIPDLVWTTNQDNCCDYHLQQLYQHVGRPTIKEEEEDFFENKKISYRNSLIEWDPNIFGVLPPDQVSGTNIN